MRLLSRLTIAMAFALLALSLATCSEQHPLKPVDDGLANMLHEPFANREAEELALHLSGNIIAPESLYGRVSNDLAFIRTEWADSFPPLLERKFRTRNIPGEVVIFLHDEIDVPEWLVRTTELESIRKQYAFDSMSITDNRITLRSRYLLNTSFLLKKLERLPGVCWAQPTLQGMASIGAFMEGDSIFYMVVVGGGLCFGGYCRPLHIIWFQSDRAGVGFVGEQIHSSGDTIPDVFKFVWSHWSEIPRDPVEDSIKFRDETPPARANDLKFIGDQVGRSGRITFTSTGDDGIEGAAYSATVCAATQTITDENFNSVGHTYVKVNPGYSGDRQSVTMTTLVGHLTNYYAVRFIDCNQNLSRVSNIVQSRNIWLNGWSHVNSSNSHLPDDRITSMLTDSRDRMWIGTYNGLACVNGAEWIVYQSTNSAIPYDLITSIAEGTDGAIWVGTPHGLGRFDGSEWQSFTRSNSSIPKDEISCVAVTKDGAVWLGYGQYGLVRFDHEAWTIFNPSNSPLNGSTVNALFCDSRGDLWIGTNWGVNRFDGENWTAFDPTNSGLGAHYSVSFFEDVEGRVWCGSSTGVVSWFDGEIWNSHRIDGGRVNSITQFEGGPIWIGAEGGLWKHESDTWLGFSGATTGLPTNYCAALIAKDSQTLWIGTGDKGLCRWDLGAARLDATGDLTRLGE